MLVATRTYDIQSGWSEPLPSELDSAQTLVLAFSAPRFAGEPAALLELSAAFPKARVLGCSSAGTIHGAKVHDDIIVIAVLRFESTRLRSASSPIGPGRESYEAGARLAAALAEPELRGVIVLSDGLHVNGSELVRGLNEGVARSVVVIGGLAADEERFKQTWVFHAGEVATDSVCAVDLYGEHVRLGHGSKGGWDIFGPERRITRSSGNVLYELDGKPALALYKEYLGDRAEGLPATALLFPLALRPAVGSEEQVVRTVLAVDDASQSLTFAGDMPLGSLAQLMKCNFDRLVQGAADAAISAADALGSSAPVFSLAISCVGRRLVLGDRIEEEVEATFDVLPEDSTQVGFYSYGELSPLGTGRCDLHNQTMTLSTIREA